MTIEADRDELWEALNDVVAIMEQDEDRLNPPARDALIRARRALEGI